MRVLITGGSGVVGSHIADRLVAEGHELLVLNALLPQAHGDGPPQETDRYELVRGDVRDASSVADGSPSEPRARACPVRGGGDRAAAEEPEL